MDGLFSPFATWMLRGDGLAGGASFTACPKGDPLGRVLLVTFLARARKVTRPYQTCFLRSRTLETGEIMPPSLNGWWAFSPVLTLALCTDLD